MKNLFRILIAVIFFGIIFYYTDNDKHITEPLIGPQTQSQPIPKTDINEKVGSSIPRPEQGLSTYIGQTTDVVLKSFGAPTRIEPSRFSYDWWVYVKDGEFIMFGVKDKTINQVYTNSAKYNVSPYMIGQELDDIYRNTIVESEIAIPIQQTIYLMMMNEQDVASRMLVAFDEVYAQLYIDKSTNTLAGVRYLDGETLVRHESYEYQYIGEYIKFDAPSSYDQPKIDMAYSNQIYNLVNDYRYMHDLLPLSRSPLLNDIAIQYSTDVVLNNLQVNSQQELQTIEDRLKENNVEVKNVGSNLAVNYYDAIEVMHGWMNSDEHRKGMLKENYNVTGTGVYLNHYTQIFGERKELINR